MLVIQQNWGKGYEYTISALEAGLGLDAAVVCIQKPFLGIWSISHSGFNLYWPSGMDKRRDIQVLTTVQKDIVNQITIENRSDLASHPYCLILDLKEPYLKSSKKLPRRTRIVNFYDNKLGEGYLWQGSTTRI